MALPFVALMMIATMPAATAMSAAPPLNVGTADHLLYDHHWTASLSPGLTLQVHRPTKMGVVVKPEHPWEPVLFAYNSLVKVSPTSTTPSTTVAVSDVFGLLG